MPVTSALCDDFQQRKWVYCAVGQLKMQTTTSQTTVNTITSVTTATRTDGVTSVDNLAASNTFVARAHVSERRPQVEEDSTDIFLFERCSPLNDF